MVVLKEIFEKVDFEKKTTDVKKYANNLKGKELMIVTFQMHREIIRINPSLAAVTLNILINSFWRAASISLKVLEGWSIIRFRTNLIWR